MSYNDFEKEDKVSGYLGVDYLRSETLLERNLRRRKMKYVISFIFISLLMQCGISKVLSQDVSISPDITCPGETRTYLLSTGGFEPDSQLVNVSFWTVMNGTIVGSNIGTPNSLTTYNNAHIIDVIWDNNSLPKSISADYYVYAALIGPYSAFATVQTITIPSPNSIQSFLGSTASNNFCSSETITLQSYLTSLWPYQYKWEVNTNNGGWVFFSTTTASSVDYVIPVGVNTIQFRYYVQSVPCLGLRSTDYGYSNTLFVYPPAPTMTITPENKICTNSATGGLRITSPTTYYPEVKFNISGPPNSNPIILSSTLSGRLINLPPGTYSVQVVNYSSTDPQVEQCASTTLGPFTIGTTNTPLSITPTVSSSYNGRAVSCYGIADGQVTLTPSGGTAPLSYRKDDTNFQPSPVFSGLSPTSYTFTIKDVNGCINTAAISLPNTPDINLGKLTPSNYNGFGVSCSSGAGSSNGGITFSPSGGTGSYSYDWKNSSDVTVGTSAALSSVGVGNYTVKVTDANNCSKTSSSITISAPTPLNPGSVTITHPQCVGASATMGLLKISGVGGGVGGYNWEIFNLSNASVSSPVPIGDTHSTPAGTYYAKITDANGCPVNTAQFTVNTPISASYSSVNASCATVSDGSLTITSPSGGSGAYTYSINNGAFGAGNTFAGLATGATYTLKVKDGNGCEFAINNAVVGLKPAITGTISQTAFINCNGQTTANVSLAPVNGTGPYTYSWSNGTTTQNLTGVGAGSYTVTISDSKPCTGSASITILQPAALTVTPGASNISCKGGSNGSINLVVTGGTGATTYLWSNAATTQNLSGLATGTYSVTVTDANGCINNSTSVAITEPATNVSVSLQSKTNVTCFGTSNGSILVTASGGTGTLTYSKDGTNFQASANFTGLAPDNYTITAKDANNCTQTTSSISITQPSAALAISSIVKNNPLCNGNANGSLVVSATGGTSPYQYSIDGTNFSSSSTIGSLPSGNYLVTVKDANNCTVVSASQSLINPALLTATVTASPQSCAAVVDGRLTVSASGGTGTLQYSINGTTFQTSSTFNGLLAGSYTVTIKDANNCTITRLATITTVAAIAGTITQSSFINCFGQSTAALNLSVSGGTGPFTYVWSNSATSQNIGSLAAGSYSVNITDSKGCRGSASFIVTQHSLLTASTTPSNYNGFGVTCNGSATGFINLTVAGGTSPFTYAWSNGATIKDISSLAAGTYSVTVTDSKGCTANASAALIAPTVVGISLNSKTNVTCNAGSDGAVVVNASGGTGTFNYSMDGVNWRASNSFGTLTQGSYTLRTRDQNNCVSPTPLTVSITQPSVILISFTGFQNSNCGAADGAVQAVASGGTGSLSYQWKNQFNTVVGNAALLSNVISGSYTVTVTDQSSCSRSSITSVGANGGATFTVVSIVAATCSTATDGRAQVIISNGLGPFTITWGNGETGLSAVQLSAGSNTVSVKDATNCSVPSVFTVPSPLPIALSLITTTSPDCVGGVNGSIQVTTSGGTGPYTYQWNGTSGTSILSGIASGTYSLQIIDSQNCPFTQSIVLADPPAISIAVVNQVSPSCSSATDGSIQVLASGGSGSFSYSWNTGITASSVNSLSAGNYTVTAKDSKNCTQLKSIDLIAPSPLSVSVASSSMVSCFGGSTGSVTLSSSGGTGTFDYSVNGGSTWQPSPTFNNLPAGMLAVQSRDFNGCIGNASFTIVQPLVLTSAIGSVVNTTCSLANGSANGSSVGGTSPYSYQWLNSANQVVSSNAVLQNAVPDTYQLIATDSKLCRATNSVTIAPSIDVAFNVVSIVATTCATSADGAAQISVSSGKSPYAVQWPSGETAPNATKLKTGLNTVIVIDADGCSAQQTFTVASPAAISLISETVFNPACVGGTGSIQVTAAGGTPPYSYQWNGQSGTGFYQNIKAGSYQLNLRDANNCSLTKSYTVVDPAPYTIDIGPDKKICVGGTLIVSSPVDAASYLWSSSTGFSSTSKQVVLTQAGSYKLKVTNTNKCTAEDTFVLTTASDLLKADFLMTPIAHVGDTVIVIDISWPLPERISWTLPKEATVLVQTPDYASMVFGSEGKFPVKLTANLADCQSEYAGIVEILKRGDNTSGGGTSIGLIKSLTVFPNPTSEGRINLKIELNEVAPVRIRLISLEGNAIVADFNGDSKDLYEYEIRLDGVAKGIYFLVVEVRNEKRVVRIVVI
jgi:large repetitive protein